MVRRPRRTPARAPAGRPEALRRLYSDLAARSRYDFLTPTPPWPVRHAEGRALRARTPRGRQDRWRPSPDRADPLATIESATDGRPAALLRLRWARMAASEFGFLRGAACVMAADLASTPASGIHVLLDGDAHLGNFGLFGTVERDVVFDLTDFDEALVGPFEWDVKRLAVSIEVAGRDLGLSRKDRRRAVRAAVEGYRRELDRLEKDGALDLWTMFLFARRRNREPRLDPATERILRRASRQAERRTSAALLSIVAQRSPNGTWRLRHLPPLQTRLPAATRAKVIASLPEYGESLPRERRYLLSRYHAVDVAHRVVGVGSVGTRDYLVLLFGNGERDPLFLQVKEATPPAAEPFAPPLPEEFHAHPGRRVVTAQRGLIGAPDLFLGWTRIDGRPYYVRQMRNFKGSVPLEHLAPSALREYVRACGAILARAHARSGDAALLAGYCGGSVAFDRAIGRFAERYADQNALDRAALRRAIRSGRVRAAAARSA